MKLGISVNKDDLSELKNIKGYDFLELSDFIFPASISKGEEIIKEALECKITDLLGMEGPIRDIKPEAGDEDIKEITITRFKTLIDLASSYNMTYILFFTTFDNLVKFNSYSDMWLENNKKFWKKLISYAEARKVMCLYCNVWDDEPYLLKQLFDYIKSDYFKFAFDIGHANYISKYSSSVWIQELKEHIKYVAIHDNNGERDDHLAIGRGNINIKKIVEEIEDKCKEVTYCIQLFNKSEIQESINMLNEYIRR
ncbi:MULTISPECIES: sugar phosphate isomerase/epimerase [Clostridium]|uniref:Sugar phosphate isomerase/epimerase n=1 Tax=Clostridium cibarium TaxID=2762247 RepID=A0ABR8PW51_9CLOT|nr:MULTISPECIES: sugar phosphate isomerase/epimerase [Clostridium]MBD7912396.1 sugar phosphate isomerase/epimerase [Clostridium cibarium]